MDLIWFSLGCPKVRIYPSYFLCELLKNATSLWKSSTFKEALLSYLYVCVCVCVDLSVHGQWQARNVYVLYMIHSFFAPNVNHTKHIGCCGIIDFFNEVFVNCSLNNENHGLYTSCVCLWELWSRAPTFPS